MPEPQPAAEARPGARLAIVLAAIPVALGLPWVLAGPNLHADDFHYLELARDAGWWRAGGPRQVGRPGAYLVYDLLYGVIGGRPVVLRLVVLALLAALTVLVWRALQLWVGVGVATAATVLWAVVPTHVALERWAACAHALVALSLVAAAAIVLARDRSRRTLVTAGLLLGAAVLTYELVIGAALLLVVWSLRRAAAADAALVVAPLAMATAWVLGWNSVYPEGGEAGLQLDALAVGAFGFGLPTDGVAQAAAVVAVAAVALAAWWVAVDRDAPPQVRAALAVGGGLLLAGVLPVIPVDPTFVGFQDRFTLVSGVGAAVLLAAVLEVARRAIHPVVAVGAAAALVGVALTARLDLEQEWHRSGERTVVALAGLDESLPREGVAWVDGPLGVDGRIAGLVDGWNATAGLRWYREADGFTVCVLVGGTPSGPGCRELVEERATAGSP